MKKLNFKLLGFLLVFPILTPFIYWGCESLAIDPITKPKSVVVLEGQIKDSRTELPIEGATVQIGNDNTVTTDANGIYQLNNAPIGAHKVIASKEGYSIKTTTAIVEDGIAQVKQLFLVALSNSVLIDSTGGEVVETFDNEEYKINIPAGAIDIPTEIAVTPLVGIELPTIPDTGFTAFATAIFGTDDILLNDSAEISMPLPINLPMGSQVPVTYFNATTNEWTEMDSLATVGLNGKTVTTKIKQLGTYAITLPTEIDATPEQETQDNFDLSCEENECCSNYRNTFNITENTNSYSNLFVTNIAEQHANTSYRHDLTDCITYTCPPEEQIGMSLFGINQAYGNHLRCPRDIHIYFCHRVRYFKAYYYWNRYLYYRWIPLKWFYYWEYHAVIYYPCHHQ